MNCPYCSHKKNRVTNKRDANNTIRRRRECLKCKKRFTTYEKIAEVGFYVVKKNGSKEKFDLEKIHRGLSKAFEKRPIPKEKVGKIATEIEESLRKKGKKEITTKKIGEMMAKKIKKLDKVAYIRFASVYRNFEDIKDFKEEIKELG